MEQLGFGQVDRQGRVVPRLEQGRAEPRPQAPAQSPSAYDMVIQALQDPRNAWIGMSPVGMAARVPRMGAGAMDILRSERGSFNPFGWGQDPRTVKAVDKLAAMDGGYMPLSGQSHPRTVTNPITGEQTTQLSTDPTSWAKLLDRRWGTYNAALKGGLQEGMTPGQAAEAARQLNFRPPGFDETTRLHNPIQPHDPRRN